MGLMNKRICAVIVNYKTPDLTIDCIQTLRKQLNRQEDHIIVIDNKSGGNDVEIIKNNLNHSGLNNWITVIEAPENNGFSYGNNIGIRAVHANYYLLTNADTLFRTGAISALLTAMDTYPDAGIISPRLEWPDGRPQISCFRFHSPLSEIVQSAGTGIITNCLKRYNVPLSLSENIMRPDWTSFACVLIRRDVFDRIGGLDEGYFMYYEDVDFCRRARRAGYDVVNYPFARVIHLRGKSSGMKALQKSKKRLPKYHYKSRARYYKTFYGSFGLICSNLCWLSGRAVSFLRERLMGKKQTVPDMQIFDIWKS